ncbi:hypothetical protein [Rhodanobacter lindaniclasticus]
MRFANPRNNRLVFLASSPARASRLRLMQAQILASASAVGACASSVTVKPAPTTGRCRTGSVKTAFASRGHPPQGCRCLVHRPRTAGSVPSAGVPSPQPHPRAPFVLKGVSASPKRNAIAAHPPWPKRGRWPPRSRARRPSSPDRARCRSPRWRPRWRSRG